MKQTALIIIATLVTLLSACSRFEYNKSLTAADSLTATSPQRALAMLDSIAPYIAEAPEHDRMYHSLLCIKAANKAYIKQTSDSTILALVDYYENNGDKQLLPEAYYYAGRIYANMNDAPRALEYYQKSEETLPSNANPKEYARICNQQAFLFLYQQLNNEAIKQFKKSYYYEELQKDTIMMAYCLKNIAFTFSENNNSDSCLFYSQKALDLAKTQNDTTLIHHIFAQIASYYNEGKRFDITKTFLEKILPYSDSNSESAYYSIAAKLYANTGQDDSARLFCYKLLDVGSIHAKLNASRLLTDIYLKHGNIEKARIYHNLLKEYTDSVNKITTTEAVNRINSLYNYNLREKENEALKAENSRKTVIIIISIALILISAMLFFVYNARHQIKQKQQTERLKNIRKRLYERSEEYIQNNNKQLKILEQELQRVSSENRLLVEKIEQQRTDLILANQNARHEQAKNQSSKIRLQTTDIYRTIQNHIKHNKIITVKEWDELDKAINTEIKNFHDSLYGYYQISIHEYHVCLLIRLGISPTDMTGLLGCTISAVSKVRKRLQEKFFGNNGTAKNFDAFVNTL